MRAEVTVPMQAGPDEVWALVSDVTRIGEFSPETFEAEWLGGASGPVVGAKFRGHVKRNGRGPTYWTTCKVTHCEPGQDFGFAVLAGDKVVNNWRYQIAATADGCAVTESFALAPSLPMKLYWAIAGKFRGKTNRNGMQQTLERIKAVVEKD
ncbi:MAG: SRPBCC family protein [Jatrophihabitans sp.]